MIAPANPNSFLEPLPRHHINTTKYVLCNALKPLRALQSTLPLSMTQRPDFPCVANSSTELSLAVVSFATLILH